MTEDFKPEKTTAMYGTEASFETATVAAGVFSPEIFAALRGETIPGWRIVPYRLEDNDGEEGCECCGHGYVPNTVYDLGIDKIYWQAKRKPFNTYDLLPKYTWSEEGFTVNGKEPEPRPINEKRLPAQELLERSLGEEYATDK